MVTESAAYRVLARYRQRRRSKGRQGGAGGAAARLVSMAADQATRLARTVS
jgi:hypothetical protein